MNTNSSDTCCLHFTHYSRLCSRKSLNSVQWPKEGADHWGKRRPGVHCNKQPLLRADLGQPWANGEHLSFLEHCPCAWSNSTSSDFTHTNTCIRDNCHSCFQIISTQGDKWKGSLGGLRRSPALDLSLLSLPRVLRIQRSRVSRHMITDSLHTCCLHITPLFQDVSEKESRRWVSAKVPFSPSHYQ